jgi:hypothetical protein
MASVQANPLLGLSDPTRPPPGLVKIERAVGVGAEVAQGAQGASAPSSAASPASAPAAPRETPLVLQLVRTDQATGRGMALINNQLLEPGARIQGWTLVSLGSHEAFLQGPKGRLRLSLTGAQMIERNPKSEPLRRGRKE